MSARLPEGPKGRALAIGVTLLGVGVLWFGVAAPILDWNATQRELLERQTVLLSRMQALAAEVPELRSESQSAAVGRGAGETALTGASDAVAAANLQQALDDLAKAVGVRIASAETLPAEAMGTWQAVTVRVTLSAPWQALVQLLKSIATAPTTMVVDNLQLRPPPPGARDPERPIETAFSVTSWRLREGGTP